MKNHRQTTTKTTGSSESNAVPIPIWTTFPSSTIQPSIFTTTTTTTPTQTAIEPSELDFNFSSLPPLTSLNKDNLKLNAITQIDYKEQPTCLDNDCSQPRSGYKFFKHRQNSVSSSYGKEVESTSLSLLKNSKHSNSMMVMPRKRPIQNVTVDGDKSGQVSIFTAEKSLPVGKFAQIDHQPPPEKISNGNGYIVKDNGQTEHVDQNQTNQNYDQIEHDATVCSMKLRKVSLEENLNDPDPGANTKIGNESCDQESTQKSFNSQDKSHGTSLLTSNRNQRRKQRIVFIQSSYDNDQNQDNVNGDKTKNNVVDNKIKIKKIRKNKKVPAEASGKAANDPEQKNIVWLTVDQQKSMDEKMITETSVPTMEENEPVVTEQIVATKVQRNEKRPKPQNESKLLNKPSIRATVRPQRNVYSEYSKASLQAKNIKLKVSQNKTKKGAKTSPRQNAIIPQKSKKSGENVRQKRLPASDKAVPVENSKNLPASDKAVPVENSKHLSALDKAEPVAYSAYFTTIPLESGAQYATYQHPKPLPALDKAVLVENSKDLPASDKAVPVENSKDLPASDKAVPVENSKDLPASNKAKPVAYSEYFTTIPLELGAQYATYQHPKPLPASDKAVPVENSNDLPASDEAVPVENSKDLPASDKAKQVAHPKHLPASDKAVPVENSNDLPASVEAKKVEHPKQNSIQSDQPIQPACQPDPTSPIDCRQMTFPNCTQPVNIVAQSVLDAQPCPTIRNQTKKLPQAPKVISKPSVRLQHVNQKKFNDWPASNNSLLACKATTSTNQPQNRISSPFVRTIAGKVRPDVTGSTEQQQQRKNQRLLSPTSQLRRINEMNKFKTFIINKPEDVQPPPSLSEGNVGVSRCPNDTFQQCSQQYERQQHPPPPAHNMSQRVKQAMQQIQHNQTEDRIDDWHCIFCNRPQNHYNLGTLFGPYHVDLETTETGANQAWFHEDCYFWAMLPMVTATNPLNRLALEVISWCRTNQCAKCAETGATVQCMGKPCKNIWLHYACASEWDYYFDESTAMVLCPDHFNVRYNSVASSDVDSEIVDLTKPK